jgi:hypothetical protein
MVPEIVPTLPRRPAPIARRIDITIARHYGATHIGEIEFRGHAAAALKRARDTDEKTGRLASLESHTGPVALGSRQFWENVFATRVTRRAPGRDAGRDATHL